jgi:hypothetical protein
MPRRLRLLPNKWLLIVLTACLQLQTEANAMANAIDSEVETQIMLLQNPFGDPQHLREQKRATEWLLANQDRAYPLLLAMVRDGTAGPAVVELMPAFNRAETVPPLEALLNGPERIAWVAGQALARHSGPEALLALRRALRRSEHNSIIAAAAGLATRGDKAACAELATMVGHNDGRVRYYIVQAAGQLGCLNRQQLEAIARDDRSEDIRELAAGFLAR